MDAWGSLSLSVSQGPGNRETGDTDTAQGRRTEIARELRKTVRLGPGLPRCPVEPNSGGPSQGGKGGGAPQLDAIEVTNAKRPGPTELNSDTVPMAAVATIPAAAETHS
jgi:hypothetical protein